jgi:hypothetical protein
MNNFNFHNLLFPSEFENFCKDIMQIRESSLTFTTYKSGQDGGIDFKATNTNLVIIGQCKLYAPHLKKNFLHGLKNELEKCKRQNADRYFLCTNLELSVNDTKQIMLLFENYIHFEDDIIDGIKLNSYLNDQAYDHLFKIYSKLLIPNFKKIEIALEDIIYRKFVSKTKIYLNEIKSKHKLFHNTQQLPYLIEKLENEKVIILSGNPGVGKTTTALMIASYFLSKNVKEFVFLEDYDFRDTLSLAKESQLIIADDFWGQNFTINKESQFNYEREFKTIVKHFTSSENSYLILTSREYVIKDLFKTADIDTEEIFNKNKFIIELKDMSMADKVKIFFNHLLFYDFEPSYFRYAKYFKSFENIINHANYSPRHLEYYIKEFRRQQDISIYGFYDSFYAYLNNPRDYWNSVFRKLNPTAKLILIILFVSGDRMDEEDLYKSFQYIQADARNTLNESINPLDYSKELIKLEEFYIYLEKNKYYYITFVNFRSPGIKDYLLEYLRSDGYGWIEPILKNAIYFNQLIFIFSLDIKENISDYDTDNNIFGNKIQLHAGLANILKQRLLSGYQTLDFSNYEPREFVGEMTRFYTLEETSYYKLQVLTEYFAIYRDENIDVRQVLLDQISKDIQNFKDSETNIPDLCLMYLPHLLELVQPLLQLDPKEIIAYFHNSIHFTSGFCYFIELKNIYPTEFNTYYKQNLKLFKEQIKEYLYVEIDYYLINEHESRLDILLSSIINEISIAYKFKFSKKYLKDIECYFGISILRNGQIGYYAIDNDFKENTYKQIPENTPDIFNLESIIDEYLPYISADNSLSNLQLNYSKELYEAIKQHENLLGDILDCTLLITELFELLINKQKDFNFNSVSELLEFFLKDKCTSLNIEYTKLLKLYFSLYSQFTETHASAKVLESTIRNSELPNLTLQNISPLIIPEKDWFKFGNKNLEIFILANDIDQEKSDIQYVERTIEASNLHDGITVMKFLDEINSQRYFSTYIYPQLEDLIKNINFENEKTIFFSYLDFFQLELEMTINNIGDKFSDGFGYGSNFWFENIFQYLGINSYFDDIVIYFIEEYHNEENLERLLIKKKYTDDLVNALLNSGYPRNESSYTHLSEPKISIIFKPLDFFQDRQNYKLAQQTGMISYFSNLIRQIQVLSKPNLPLAPTCKI